MYDGNKNMHINYHSFQKTVYYLNNQIINFGWGGELIDGRFGDMKCTVNPYLIYQPVLKLWEESIAGPSHFKEKWFKYNFISHLSL